MYSIYIMWKKVEIEIFKIQNNQKIIFSFKMKSENQNKDRKKSIINNIQIKKIYIYIK